jgi:two-component system, NarL family, nitrate/nitrite response regulator NarL
VSREARPATVIVVARDSMYAARVEAALRGLAGWCVEVGAPGQLAALLPEHPDAIVVLALGEAETRRALRAMRGSARRPAVVALSDSPARSWTAAARALGLRAVLPIRATPEELDSALRAVRAGLLAVHAEALAQPVAGGAQRVSGLPLTSREREILELIADGANNRVIAARLAISRHTVKFHVASILDKLGAGSRAEAVAVALRTGLLAV